MTKQRRKLINFIGVRNMGTSLSSENVKEVVNQTRGL